MLGRIVPIVALLALVVAPAAIAGSPHKHAPKAKASIVGGQNAGINDWPSIAFILAGWDGDGTGRSSPQPAAPAP